MYRLFALGISVLSVNAFAENNKPLQINSYQNPPEISEQAAPALEPQQFSKEQDAYNIKKSTPFSLAAGFSGSDLKDSEGEGEKGKGFFINGAYHIDNSVNFWMEFDQQKSSDQYYEFSYLGEDIKVKYSYDLTEIAFGAQYKWNAERLYAGIGTGLGFSRLKLNAEASAVIGGVNYSEKESETYDYYTWRVAELELGANVNNNLSIFANVGYKLLLSLETDTECGAYYCESGRAEEMDLDGATYKAGLRYSF